MSLLTSLAGPVLGLVGKLFGSKKKKEEVVNRVDYARMVADAEAAGFNPLTALRNGGAAGFSVTSQPVLSSKHAAIGDAIGSIGNFISNFDPFEDKLREAQYGVMQMQLSNLQSNTMAAPARMFDVPAVTGRTKVAAGPVLSTVRIGDYDYRGTGKGGEIEDMYVAYRNPDGTYVRAPNPNLPDGEQMLVPPFAGAESEAAKTYQNNPNVWKDYQLPNVVEMWRNWAKRDYDRESRRRRAYEANRR